MIASESIPMSENSALDDSRDRAIFYFYKLRTIYLRMIAYIKQIAR
jgi:hypothetical protein